MRRAQVSPAVRFGFVPTHDLLICGHEAVHRLAARSVLVDDLLLGGQR